MNSNENYCNSVVFCFILLEAEEDAAAAVAAATTAATAAGLAGTLSNDTFPPPAW